jgi:two-component system, LytTR family, sensor kinase
MKSFWDTIYKYKIHHILLWIGYFVFWMAYYAKYYPSLISLSFTVGIYFVFHSLPFYITSYYLFPRFLYTRKYGMFVLLFLLTVLLSSLNLSVILYFMLSPYVKEIAGNPTNVFQIALMSILLMVGALCAVKLVIDKIRTDKNVQQLNRQRLETELQYLKAQVNPHFLFNAINSVYFLIKKNPDQAAETLIKLSDLLRFQLYDCSGEKIPIEKELEYLMNFVALEQVRKGDKVKVSFDIADGTTGFSIAPFLLIPFMENAFKHVSSFSDRDNIIEIEFFCENNQFKAVFRNTTDNLIRHEVGGIGLKNVKRRLELLYPGKHELIIRDREGYFQVDFALTLLNE